MELVLVAEPMFPDSLTAYEKGYNAGCIERQTLSVRALLPMYVSLERADAEGFPRDHKDDADWKRGRLAAYREEFAV